MGMTPKAGSQQSLLWMNTLMLACAEHSAEATPDDRYDDTQVAAGLSRTHIMTSHRQDSGVMALTRKREPDWSGRASPGQLKRLPIILSGAEIPVVATHKSSVS